MATAEKSGPETAKDQFLAVAVSTTSGFFPEEGFSRVPAHQPVRHVLEKAAHELKLTDTESWIASVAGPTGQRLIAVDKSYLENDLTCMAEIDWGPAEGGGG